MFGECITLASQSGPRHLASILIVRPDLARLWQYTKLPSACMMLSLASGLTRSIAGNMVIFIIHVSTLWSRDNPSYGSYASPKTHATMLSCSCNTIAVIVWAGIGRVSSKHECPSSGLIRCAADLRAQLPI